MKNWIVNSPDNNIISKIMSECKVSSLTASSLVSKGYSSPESIMQSLECNELSDPFLIKDMKKAADILNNAIEEGLKICIYGDYDCDGIMSTAILYSYLSETGADVIYYIPERSEGYGLNNNAIDKIKTEGVNLIVTVDNGISAISEAEYIYSLGMKLIVTDHHQQGESLPKAEAVVDPHRHDCFSPFKYACGAVIALKLAAAMDGGNYTMVLEQFGDLAAIATVADIVSLTGENRFIVSYGMELINNTDRVSLIALKEVSGLNGKKVDSRSIGFGLAPRINASGRFGSPTTALKLMLCEDYEKAMSIAQELDRLNTERKNAEGNIINDIYEMIEKNPMLTRGRVIFLCGKGWHHGVIGIVASKILERFGKPCFIASEDNGEIRGSARSFGEFSIFSALSYATESLVKFGGHPGAGGFTIKNGMAEEFNRLIEEYAFKNHPNMPIYSISADSKATASQITVDNIKGLELLEPFGQDNEKPLYLIENAEILNITPLSEGKHSKLSLKLENKFIDALMFRVSPNELCVKKGDICDMIVDLSINEFRGNLSPSIYINDIRIHGFEQSRYFIGTSTFEAFLRGEELPENYYNGMLPSREHFVLIYKTIPDEGIAFDTLYIRNSKKLNFCRFAIAIEAFRQLGLVTVSASDSRIKRTAFDGKADLDSAPVMVSLRNKINNIK